MTKDKTQIIIAACIEHIAFQHGTRRNHADDFPLDQPFCSGRVLHLLADCHLIPLFDQSGYVVFAAVVRDAAHRRTLIQTALLAGQGQLQLPRGNQRIVKKQLIKISQPKKQQLLQILLLDLPVLAHHRGKSTDIDRFARNLSFHRRFLSSLDLWLLYTEDSACPFCTTADRFVFVYRVSQHPEDAG